MVDSVQVRHRGGSVVRRPIGEDERALARIALITNPKSGSGSASSEELTDALAEHRGEVVAAVSVTELDEADLDGAERIVVAGGDGSIGPAAARAAQANVPLAVIPAGTANDFARALDLPRELGEAVRLAATGEQLRRLDLARMGERPFLNVASAGLAVQAAERAADLKEHLGPAAYTAGAVGAGLTGLPVRAGVRVDSEELFDGEAWQLIVANTGHFGGGSLVPADPGDGALDVVVIPAAGRAQLARRAYGLRTGTIAEQDGVVTGRGARVEVSDDLEFNVDGELCAGGGPFTVTPGAVEVVVG
jgi:diacylglycerol kinase (ATP)